MNRSRLNGVRINDSPEIVIVIIPFPLFISIIHILEYNIKINDNTEYDISLSDSSEYTITITQVGDNINTYQVGESPKFEVETRNTDNNLADPASVLIYIRRPDGTLSVDGITMEKSEVGKYYYEHDINSQVGTHYIKVKAIGSGARVTIQPDNFKVVESFEV